MVVANIHETKTHLSRLLEQVEQGEEVIIARSGRPIAKLVRYIPEHKTRIIGTMEGQIVIHDDFDDDLPPDIMAAFNGELP